MITSANPVGVELFGWLFTDTESEDFESRRELERDPAELTLVKESSACKFSPKLRVKLRELWLRMLMGEMQDSVG